MEQKQKDDVKIGTLLAPRALHAAAILDLRDRPWIAETPQTVPGQPSVYKLPEWRTMSESPWVHQTDLDQCQFGADCTKPTSLMGGNIVLTDMAAKCQHPKTQWRIPWSGEIYEAAHPRLRGRQKAIPIDQWRMEMLRNSEPSGPWLTTEAAHYPAQLNFHLTARLVWAIHLSRNLAANLDL